MASLLLHLASSKPKNAGLELLARTSAVDLLGALLTWLVVVSTDPRLRTAASASAPRSTHVTAPSSPFPQGVFSVRCVLYTL